MSSVKRGLLIIVSGPAGTGKTTLCDRMLAEESGIQRVVTSTTRSSRKGEQDKVDYYFFSRPEFEEKILAGEFYEHAQVHTNLYGTLRSEVLVKLDAGTDLLLNIDVQGAKTYQALAKSDPLLSGRVVSIFIVPPSLEELEQRLSGRGSDDASEIQRRLKVALNELEFKDNYDYQLKSKSKDSDFESLKAIYRAEKMRVRQ